MKTKLIISILCFCTLVSFGQEEKTLGAFESDTTWLKEIIHFPIGFAPEINYEGYEDLRFAKSWRDQAHPDFWCYTFVWHVKGIQKPTLEELDGYLTSYFNGLMTAVNKKENFTIPETNVMLTKTDPSKEAYDFTGKIEMYDSFTSETVITLNVRISITHCEIKNESLLRFEFSPKDYDQPIWQRFKDIKIKTDICE